MLLAPFAGMPRLWAASLFKPSGRLASALAIRVQLPFTD